MAFDIRLNSEQVLAAQHKEGPFLLLAGPGTGKTATLTARIGYLLEDNIPEDNLLVITFTQAAAQELRDRIADLLGHDPALEIGTFHGIAKVLMKKFPREFPGLKGRKLLDDFHVRKEVFTIARALVRKRIGRVDRVSEEDIEFLSSSILSVKEHWEGNDEDFDRYIESEGNPDLREGFLAYQDLLKKKNGYDFSDLIIHTVLALRNTRFRDKVTAMWTYVLVDEYQDINRAQHVMISLLLNKKRNLWAVGDDDQALYGWRHADVRLLLNFKNEYKGAVIASLRKNYRSSAYVVALANKLIRNNRLRFPKVLIATRSIPLPVMVHRTLSERSEAVWIARRIRADLDEGSLLPSDFAIIARSNAVLTPIARILSREGVPARVRGAPPFWTLRSVRMAVGLLAELLGDWPDTPPKVFENIVEKARDHMRVQGYKDIVQYTANFLRDNPPRAQSFGEGLDQWLMQIEEFRMEAESVDSPEALLLKMRLDEDDTLPMVTLCTIHASKGLQWRNVFVCACEEGVMPSTRSDDIEEERRIAYVAITRSSGYLCLSYAQERNRVPHEPSRFLREMLRMSLPGSVWDARQQRLESLPD